MANDTASKPDETTTAVPVPPEAVPNGILPPRVSRFLRPFTAVTESWRVFAVAAVLACAVLGAALWASAHVHPTPALRTVALFVHLASVVLGLGAVLVADYFFLLWLLNRSTLAEALRAVGRLHLPIWAGLTGLVCSGILLQPDLGAGMTQVKLSFVAVLTVNGLQAAVLSKRMAAAAVLTPRLLAWGGLTTAVSQVCWWGSMWIGFWTANGPG